MDFPGKNTEAGCHFLLQGLRDHFLHFRFDLEIKPVSLASPALAGGFFTTSTSWAEYKFILKLSEFCGMVQHDSCWTSHLFLSLAASLGELVSAMIYKIYYVKETYNNV